MLAPATMNPTEQLLFDAIEKEFYRNIDSTLLMLGYTGSFKEPYDERKNLAKKDIESKGIINIFVDRPRPISVGFRTAGSNGCRLYIDASRNLTDYTAKWLVDHSSNAANRRSDLKNLARLFGERSAVTPLPDVFEPVDVLRAFGIDTTDTVLSDSFEDIEVDIDNPLGLDFPDIKDDD